MRCHIHKVLARPGWIQELFHWLKLSVSDSHRSSGFFLLHLFCNNHMKNSGPKYILATGHSPSLQNSNEDDIWIADSLHKISFVCCCQTVIFLTTYCAIECYWSEINYANHLHYIWMNSSSLWICCAEMGRDKISLISAKLIETSYLTSYYCFWRLAKYVSA